MTAVVPQFVTKSYKSNQDGKFYGSLEFNGAVVASTTEGQDNGFKSDKDFDAWAVREALEHKASNSPEPSHKVEKTFSV